MKHKEFWASALSDLGSVLPKHAINAWFEPLDAIGVSEGNVLLEAPNKFFCEWIDSHYKIELKTSIQKTDKSISGYRFSIGTKPSKEYEESALVQKDIKKGPTHRNNLNSQYTFKNFIEGSNNEFAKNAGQSVAENPGENNFNPLTIYGGVGLGKTHLMHAIGNQALLKNPSLNVVVVTSERFTLDFVNSLRKNKTIEFAQQYRSADMLLIDDVQFFRGKEQTQEQFFHTFNVLHQSGKQIVMTADKYPGEMKGLQSRLLSRFQSGLSVDVQPPNFEVRVAILLEKAEQNGVALDYEFIEFIAKHIKNNVRDLEGAVIRVLAKSSLLNKEIDHTLVRDVVRERIGGSLKVDMTIEEIVKKVSEVSSVPEKEIVGKSRKMEIAQARQVSMFLSREILGKSLSGIGMYFGGRDHTTVMHAIKTISDKVDSNDVIGNTISKLRTELNQSF
tara:strand:+ start:3128 stop:4468 length:1341 start_codon:yes stop_codon:yes gene_type:complete